MMFWMKISFNIMAFWWFLEASLFPTFQENNEQLMYKGIKPCKHCSIYNIASYMLCWWLRLVCVMGSKLIYDQSFGCMVIKFLGFMTQIPIGNDTLYGIIWFLTHIRIPLVSYDVKFLGFWFKCYNNSHWIHFFKRYRYDVYGMRLIDIWLWATCFI